MITDIFPMQPLYPVERLLSDRCVRVAMPDGDIKIRQRGPDPKLLNVTGWGTIADQATLQDFYEAQAKDVFTFQDKSFSSERDLVVRFASAPEWEEWFGYMIWKCALREEPSGGTLPAIPPRVVQGNVAQYQEFFPHKVLFKRPTRPGNVLVSFFNNTADTPSDDILLHDDGDNSWTRIFNEASSPSIGTGHFLAYYAPCVTPCTEVYTKSFGAMAWYSEFYILELRGVDTLTDSAYVTGHSSAPGGTVGGGDLIGLISQGGSPSAQDWQAALLAFTLGGAGDVLRVCFVHKISGGFGTVLSSPGESDLFPDARHDITMVFGDSDAFPLVPDYSIPRTLVDPKVRAPLQDGNTDVRSNRASLMAFDLHGLAGNDTYDKLLAFYEGHADIAWPFTDSAFTPPVVRNVKFTGPPTFEESGYDTVTWKCTIQEVPA